MACPCNRPLGADAAAAPTEPGMASVAAQTVGWLLLGTLVGAACWVTGGELKRVMKGQA